MAGSYWHCYWHRHRHRYPNRHHTGTATGTATSLAVPPGLPPRHSQRSRKATGNRELPPPPAAGWPAGHAEPREAAGLTSTGPSVVTGTAAMSRPRSRRPGTASSLRALPRPRPGPGPSNGCPEQHSEPHPLPLCWAGLLVTPPHPHGPIAAPTFGPPALTIAPPGGGGAPRAWAEAGP